MQQISNLELWGGMEYTINRVNNEYFDQLSYTGHYNRTEDIDVLIASGITTIRFPILWEKHQPSYLTQIDWTYTANILERLRDAGITVIAGLVHHGSGPEYVNFFDDTFEDGLQAYASAVALKFPWIQYYTPVNEPLTTARFCGLYGHWYPHGKNDKCFSRILVSECKATVKAMMAIRKVNPTAKLVLTEDLAKVYSTPALQYQADFENERRWLSFDLIAGKVVRSHPLWDYLIDAGIQAADLAFLTSKPISPDIMGINYYTTSERFLDENIAVYPTQSHGGNAFQQYADVEAVRVNIPGRLSLKALISEAWERNGWTIALTEVHLQCTREEQMRWFYEMWNTALALRAANIPVIAVTAWALFGSFGWNKLLTEKGGLYESGAYIIRNNRPEPTALLKLMKALSKGQQVKHPVLEIPGWWHCEERILYRVKETPPKSLHTRKLRPVAILYKSDHIKEKMEEICKYRKLDYYLEKMPSLEIVHRILEEENPWAVIDVTGELLITVKNKSLTQLCHRFFTYQIRKKAIQMASVCHHLPDSVIACTLDNFYEEEINYNQECLILSSDDSPISVNGSQLCEEPLSKEFEALANILIDFMLDDVKGVHHL